MSAYATTLQRPALYEHGQGDRQHGGVVQVSVRHGNCHCCLCMVAFEQWLAAQVDTHAKRGDAKLAPSERMGSAVPQGMRP